MKKKILITAMSLTCLISGVNATGIPTVDVANTLAIVAENVKTLKQWEAQIEAMKNQFNEMKKQGQDAARRFDGNSNLGDLLNTDTFYDFLPKAANDITGFNDNVDIAALRNEYQLNSINPLEQQEFDQQLKKMNNLKKNYDVLSKRTESLKKIKELSDRANTPQEKQDVANMIAYENAQMFNESLKTTEARAVIEQENELQRRQRSLERDKKINELRKLRK